MTSLREPIGIMSVVVTLLALWPAIAAGAKRCHDRNRSGWFQLVFLIPIVFFWPIIEIYFLRGTKGTNRFGPDPLAGESQAFTAPGLPGSHGSADGGFSDSDLSRG